MGSPKIEEMKLIYKFAKNSKFIIETGSGLSTKYLAKIANKYGAKVYSINIELPQEQYESVIYKKGWSITYDDLIKPGDLRFVISRYKNVIDGKIIFDGLEYMTGETDMIRKILSDNDMTLDFFFCDTGEYCGLAEWNIVKNVIPPGGRFAAHDIYYPKSIKCFQIVKEIEASIRWKILLKTKSKQGLFIAERL